MAILTREQFLSNIDTQPREFESAVWGGSLKYRPATVGDKSSARRKATKAGVLDDEDFELYLIVQCVLDPKLGDLDAADLRGKSAKEINRLAAEIVGNGGNPRP